MKGAVLQHGWDGEWFLRAYDAFGSKVGSNTCEEGQIFIEPQGLCIMAGIGLESGHAAKAISSGHKRLTGKYGIEVLSPCYTKYRKELSEISSYPPGYKETAPFSVRPTRGSASQRRNSAMRSRPWKITAASALHILMTSAMCTAQNHTYTARGSPDGKPRATARRKTAGSPRRRPGRS